MTLNEILAKQNIINSILLKDNSNELSKELKVKIVRLKIALNKIKKQTDIDIQEFTKNLIPEELKKLQEIPENSRTEENNLEIQKLSNKINSDYKEFIIAKGNETISIGMNDSFTEEEFDSLIAINAGKEVNINGNTVKGEDLMEAFYTLFVNKN